MHWAIVTVPTSSHNLPVSSVCPPVNTVDKTGSNEIPTDGVWTKKEKLIKVSPFFTYVFICFICNIAIMLHGSEQLSKSGPAPTLQNNQ